MTERKRVDLKLRVTLVITAIALAGFATAATFVELPGPGQVKSADAPSRSSQVGDSPGGPTLGESVTNILDHGAVGDGVTSDQAAWNAAVDATPLGGTLLLPPDRMFALPRNLNIDKPLQVLGHGATIVKPPKGPEVNAWINVTADDVSIEGITFSDPSDLITGSVLFAKSVDRARIKSNTFNSRRAISVQVVDTRETLVEGNDITGAREGITVSGPSEDVVIKGNSVAQWRNFGIYLYGRESGAPSRIEISGNRVTELAPGGYPRYPIHTSDGESRTRISNLLVLNNVVLGPGKSFTANQGGTADQISIHSVDGVQIEGNVSRGGGDMGITVEGCNDAIVRNNVVSKSDVAGIAVFTDVVNASVKRNTVLNNGQNRAGDRPPSGRAGIRLSTSATKGPRDVEVMYNVTGNTQGSQTQQYGVSVRSSTSVVVGPNVDAGNAVSLYLDEANNSGLSLLDDPAG